MVMQASLSQIWSMINTMQLIVLMPLFKVNIPANADMLFKKIMEIAAFELVDLNDPINYMLNL